MYLEYAVCVVGTVLAVAVLAWPGVSWQLARARLRKRLRARVALDEGQWFAQYMPVDVNVQTELKEVLIALGQDLGVEWARLRPEDSFNETLCVGKFTYIFGELDYFWSFVDNWIERRNIRPNTGQHLKSLGELLRGLAHALEDGRLSPTGDQDNRGSADIGQASARGSLPEPFGPE